MLRYIYDNINQHLDEIRLQQSKSMRNHYKFQEQIKSMQQLFQTNIFIAQIANTLLDKIPHQLVELAAKELNFFYQEKYLREDEEKYQQIKMTLNIIAKNKACNIDELFMNLGTQINNYYDNDYLHLQKRKPYLKQCRFCKKNASNYMNGLRQHEYKCKDNPEGKYQFPIDKKVKRFDTKESYQKRQSKLQQRSHQQFIEIDQQAVNHLAKKKSSKRRKRQDKQQALILYCQKQSHAREKEIYDGFDDQNEVYHQENDEQLIKQSRNRLDIQGISTINPTVRDFQLLENEPQENKKIQEENYNQFLE